MLILSSYSSKLIEAFLVVVYLALVDDTASFAQLLQEVICRTRSSDYLQIVQNASILYSLLLLESLVHI